MGESATSSPRPLIIIAATQRSGTAALELTLAESSAFAALGEVFRPRPLRPHDAALTSFYFDPRTNFFEYARNVLDKRQLTDRSPDNQFQILKNYLEYLSRCTSPATGLLDVKLNSWHHFDSGWQGFTAPPAMIEFVRRLGVPVLHLIRGDVFTQALSGIIAQHRGVWHAMAPLDEPIQPIVVDPELLGAHMRSIVRDREAFGRVMHGYALYFELAYEHLFNGNSLAPAVVETLGQMAGRPGLKVTSHVPLARTTPQPDRWVANFEDLQERFKDAENAAGYFAGAEQQVIDLQRQVQELKTEQRLRAELEAARTQEEAALHQQLQAMLQDKNRVCAERDSARSQLMQVEGELCQSQDRIKSMESSKFWKLRCIWLRTKAAIGGE